MRIEGGGRGARQEERLEEGRSLEMRRKGDRDGEERRGAGVAALKSRQELCVCFGANVRLQHSEMVLRIRDKPEIGYTTHCTQHLPLRKRRTQLKGNTVHTYLGKGLYTTVYRLYTTFYGLYTGSLWGWFRCATGVHNMFYICTRRLPYEKSVYKRFYLVWLILLVMSSVCPQEASPPIHCKGAPAHSAFAHRAVVGNPPRGPPQGSWGRARGNQAVHVETGAPNLIDEPRTVCRHPARLVPK